jgi:hypothetical protein
MLAKLTTYALVGIDALPVEVEVDTAHGLPKTILVGLPETAVKESVHRAGAGEPRLSTAQRPHHHQPRANGLSVAIGCGPGNNIASPSQG